MAIEVGALTLAVGIDKGTVIQQLRQIDAAVERSAKRGARANYSAAKEYKEWWRDALRQREADERRVSVAQKAAIRSAAAEAKKAQAEMAAAEKRAETQTANYWMARRRHLRAYQAEVDAANKKEETQNANYWMARRRYLRSYQAEYKRLLVERDRLEAAEERKQAAYHLARLRRERELSLAHAQAIKMDAAMTAASQRRAAQASAAAARQAQRQQLAAQKQAQALARREAAAKRPMQFGGPGFGALGLTATFLGTAGLAKLISTANEMQVVQQRLQQVSKSTEEANLVFKLLGDSSQRLRAPLGEMAELFSKLRQSNENVGLSVNETLKVTEAFTAALRLSGATGQTAASALLQFGQAMAKGNLDGDEFRTIAENNSEVLLVLQREYGKTRAEILKMREEGQLTADMMAKALIKQYDSLIERSTKLAPTISQGATAISNSLLIVITKSGSAKEAIEKLGIKMTEFASFFQKNGPLILGVGAFAAGLWTIYRAAAALQGLLASGTIIRFLSLFARGGPVGIIGAAIGVGTMAYQSGKQVGEAEYAQEDARRIEAMASFSKGGIEKAMRERFENSVKAEREIAELQKKLADIPNTFSNTKPRSDVQGRINTLKSQLSDDARNYKLLFEALKLRRELDKLDAKGPVAEPGATGAGAGKAVKEEKDNTDDLIESYLKLYEAGILNEESFNRLTELRDEAQSVLMSLADKTSLTEEETIKLADAYDRVSRINDVLAPVNMDLDEQEELVSRLNDNYDNLTASLQRYANALTAEKIKQLTTELHALQVQLGKAFVIDDKEKVDEYTASIAELQAKIAELQKLLFERNATGMGTGGKPTEGEKEELSDYQKRLEQLRLQILDMFREAPADVFIGFFEGLGRQWAEGGRALADTMRSVFANMFSSIGQSLVRYAFSMIDWKAIWGVVKVSFGKLMAKMGIATGVLGKFLTSIKAFLTNPLVAGPALIAVGAAMVAYGAKMGAIGRGGGGDGLIGTIGNLGVNTPGPRPLVYTFGNRENPFQGARQAAAAGRDSIIFNATIIGANDPKAQRDVADLIGNAARRGLINGNGMRTG